MSKQAIATAHAPAAIGPYSQGIRLGSIELPPPGLIFTAGQVALDPATQQMVPGGITEQTTRVMENLKAILEAAGSSMARVVKATVFLKDFDDFAAMNAVYATLPGAQRHGRARTHHRGGLAASQGRAGRNRPYRRSLARN